MQPRFLVVTDEGRKLDGILDIGWTEGEHMRRMRLTFEYGRVEEVEATFMPTPSAE